MKKNFFKKLAFVLAFAMVATSIAPVSAGAATTPTIKGNATQYLLLNDEADTSYDFNINNKVTGSKYSWSSSDEAVATVDNSGVVEAVGIGTAKITCKITFPTKKTKKLYATVIVKENMDSITISNAPTAAVAIGATYDLNRTYTTVTGGKSTDVTKWFITKGNDKKVASIDNYGKFVSTDAGEFEVVARAYQSNAKFAADAADFTAESAPVTVKVVPSIVSVTQTTDKQFVVTFDAVMKDVVKKDNLSIADANGVKLNNIKAVTFDTTGKIATVDTFYALTDKAVYTVAYGDLSKDFTASIGAVAKVVITGPSVVEDNVAKAITVKYYDANNVEVAGDAAKLTFKTTNNVGWVNGNEITLFNVGNQAAIQATYSTGTYDANWQEVVLTSDVYTVTAVDSLAATLSSVTAWTIASAPESSASDYTAVDHDVTVDQTGCFLNVKSVNSADTAIYDFSYESTDSTKLLVNPTTGELYPVATGTVPVIVTNGTFKAVVNVEVKAARAANSISVDKTGASVSALVGQTATYVVTVKDQYGSNFAVSSTTVDVLSKPSTDTTTALYMVAQTPNSDKSVNFVFTPAAATQEGTYTYKLTAAGKSVVVSVVVYRPTDVAVTNYRFALDTTSYDTVVSSSADGKITLGLHAYGYNKSGIAVTEVLAPTSITATNTADSSITYNLTSSKVITGAANGTYAVTGTYNDGTKTWPIYTTAFEVKNSQVKASIAQSGSKVTATALTLNSEIAKLFTATTNASANSAVVSVAAGDVVASASTGTFQVLVKAVTVTETFGTNTVVYTVTVNQVITATVQ